MASIARVLAAAGMAAAADMKCPGSAALVHASCQVAATAEEGCARVMEEMVARVAANGKHSWVDPHNNGTYALLDKSDNQLLFSRTSGSKSFGSKTYTDKVLFTFEAEDEEGSCKFYACSESQGTSVGDFSTNYCNIRNLYCGKADGCSALKFDFATKEAKVSPSIGASKDPSACVVKSEPKHEEPCCKKCELPLVKFFSTDAAHGFCGEACMDPTKYDLYHKFEANLTRAKDDTPCSEQYSPDNKHKFTDFFSTVTHGAPGLLSVTLDLYAPNNVPDHSCCFTPLLPQLECVGIPGKPTSLNIFGTGPYCCPKGATEENPCAKGVDAELIV